jgi:hypothetical protein
VKPAILTAEALCDLAAPPEQWRRIRCCAICDKSLGGAKTFRGYYLRGDDGIALFRTHEACAERLRREKDAQRKLISEAGANINLLVGEPAGHA